MEKTIFNDLYAAGKWTSWMRDFKIGEEQVREVTKENLPSIRATATKMSGKGYYFRIMTKDNQLWIKRLTFEEWMEVPHRSIV